MARDQGENICHWELDPQFFAAFRNGIKCGKLYEAEVEYTRNVFGKAREDE